MARRFARRFGANRRGTAVVGRVVGGNRCGPCGDGTGRPGALDAQAVIAPLLDPSMNHVGAGPASIGGSSASQDIERRYRAYMPRASHRVDPFAAPLASLRLAGLPPAFIAVEGADLLRSEGEVDGAELASTGVLTRVISLSDAPAIRLNKCLSGLRGLSAFPSEELRLH